jgi:DNA-dependent RNA polymerase auxiliary subunit epsilon
MRQEQIDKEIAEMAKAARARQLVKECYFREGVNYIDNCKDVILAYGKLIYGEKGLSFGIK